MAVSTRTRFEVFKRDAFTCLYCGQRPPHVLLEVDHVHPLVAGGGDEIENLITACRDCNRGKAGIPLGDRRPVVSREATEELRERVWQAQAYMELVAQQRGIQDSLLDRVHETWARAFGAELVERVEDGVTWRLAADEEWPEARSIRYFLRELPLDEVLAAVDATSARWERSVHRTVRYFYGVCHAKIRAL